MAETSDLNIALNYQCILCHRTVPDCMSGLCCDECIAANNSYLSSDNEELLDDTYTYRDAAMNIPSSEFDRLHEELLDIHDSFIYRDDLLPDVLNFDNLEDAYTYRDDVIDIPLRELDDLENLLAVTGNDYVGNSGDYANTAEYERLLQSSMDIDGGSHGTLPASKLEVEKLENVVIGEKDGKQALDCTICLELVNVGEVAKVLPCGHGFHGDCISTWLFSRNSCPLCRSHLPTDDSESRVREERFNS